MARHFCSCRKGILKYEHGNQKFLMATYKLKQTMPKNNQKYIKSKSYIENVKDKRINEL
jgi:uncharacterized protein YbgA (DUF1722 family)